MPDNETIADIIAEMRGIRVREFQEYADRFDAAHRRDTKELRVEVERLKEERNYSGVRERERLRAKGFAIIPKEQLKRGDAAKLREVAEFVAHIDDNGYTSHDVQCAIDKARAALSAPPRNCDVGTAEEQSERMDAAYCSKRLCAKGECPLFKPGLDCSLIWAQMHYEEGGAE